MATHHAMDSHVHFLVTDPDWDAMHRVVCANFTSLKDATVDQSCIVEPGEHRLVSRRSVVVFHEARIVDVDNLVAQEAARNISRRESLSKELHDKIVRAFAVSKFAPIKTKQMLKDQGLI